MFVCIYVYVDVRVCVCVCVWVVIMITMMQNDVVSIHSCILPNCLFFFVLTWMSCCHLNEMLSIISTVRTSRNVFLLLLINASAHCRALLQNMGFMSPFHFLYSSFSSLQLMSPLFPLPHTFTDTHSCVGCRTYAAPRGGCGGQRSGPRLPAPIKWTDSWWEGERERERESMASLQTQKHSSRILITANILAMYHYLRLQPCLW